MSYFDDHEDDIIWGRHRREREHDEPRDPVCKRCGAVCKWRVNDNGKWQLFDQKRGEHNRNVPHQCNPTTADDFDDLS